MHHLAVAPRAIAPGAPRPRRARGGFGTGALSRPARRPRLVRVASADDEPNATWDADSEQTGLSAQLRTTNALREKLSRALFDVDPSLVDEDVVYTSQVHEARGKRAYDELMREWKPLVKRNLQSFTYDAERAFCPEPGVLLVRWRAEWDGAFNADAAMVKFIEENFPEYDPEELARLRAEVEGADRTFSGYREYDVRGITTVRVNREGKVVTTRLDESALEQLALATGGRYFRGTAAQSEIDAIAEALTALDEKEFGAVLRARYKERFQIPLALAVLAFLAETLFGDRKRGVVAEQQEAGS